MHQSKGRLQNYDWDCGPCAAGTALELLGVEQGLASKLLLSLPCGERGTDPATMEAWLRTIDCRTQSGDMTVRDLAHHTRLERPVLALIQSDGDGHWVAVNSANARSVFYYCSVWGQSKMSARQFQKLWWDWDRRGNSYPGFGIALWSAE